MNRVTQIDYPGDLGDEEFGYTGTGNVQWKKDCNSKVTLCKYDTYGRLINVYYNYTGSLTEIVYPTAVDIAYSYLNGTTLIASMADSTGTSSFGYDYRNQLISYTPPQPSGYGAISYTYNSLGQKTSVSHGSLTTNYAYYADGSLKDVKKGSQLIAAYGYDQVGNLTRIDYGNATYQLYSYLVDDPQYKLDKIQYAYRCAVGQPVAVQGSLAFTKDNAGNPLTRSVYNTSSPAINVYGSVYSYDQMDRLSSANYPGKGTTRYSYDFSGNRLQSGFEYNSINQLTTSPGKSYTYDQAGNLTTTAGTAAKTYTYDYVNMMTSVGHSGVPKSSLMTWDAAGNRITFGSSTRINDADKFSFVYDITAGIPAVTEEIAPGGGIVTYIREPSGGLLARITGTGASESIQYYHFDELGSTLFLTDSNGVISDKYTYDAHGNVTSHSGGTQQPYQYVGAYGYYTHYQDQNLPYIQTGFRLYSPGLGRYIQEDPAQDGVNWYEYCAGNPLSSYDPYGLLSDKECRQKFWDIQKQMYKLSKELDKYNPYLDYYGNCKFRNRDTGKVEFTKPNGHYDKINNLKRGLKNLMDDFIKGGCGGKGQKIPQEAWELSKRKVEQPKPWPKPAPIRWSMPTIDWEKVGAGAAALGGALFSLSPLGRCLKLAPTGSVGFPFSVGEPTNSICNPGVL